jgi:hypothetical protein
LDLVVIGPANHAYAWGGIRQGALHRNGFALIHPYAAARFTESGAVRGVVLGTG